MASTDSSVYRPTPTPDHDTTVVVVVFVSLGCVMFLAFLAFVIWFLIKKGSRKHREKSEAVCVDEHFKMKEAIVEGPNGQKSVMLSVEDDVKIEDAIKRDEKDLKKDGGVGSSVVSRS